MTIYEAIIHCEEVMVENLEKTKDRNASDPIAINCFECADEHRQLAEWLKELKQLREQTTWIPCSERLPEDKETVLVTFKHFVSGNTIGLGSVILLRGKPHWYVREQSLGTYDVLAWIPLPKPYKGE